MDYGLTDQAVALRQEVRSFVEDELAPVAAEIDREDRYPAAVLAALGDHGYTGLTIDTDYGGGGGSLLELTVLVEELSVSPRPSNGSGPTNSARPTCPGWPASRRWVHWA